MMSANKLTARCATFRITPFLIASFLIAAICSTGFSQSDTARKPGPEINKARRTELLNFVKQHHPEIRPLLNTLRKNRPGQYTATMRTLNREVTSIQRLESRAPERHKKALALWITKSKIKLLSAQLALQTTDADKRKIRRQIRALFGKQANLREQQIAVDIKAAHKRLARLNSQMTEIKSDRNERLNRQMKSVVRNAQRVRDKQANEKRDRAKRPGNQRPSDNRRGNKRVSDKRPAAKKQNDKNKATPQRKKRDKSADKPKTTADRTTADPKPGT